MESTRKSTIHFLIDFIRKTRGKSGMHLVPTFKLRDVLEENQRNQHIGMYGLASDQSPMIKKTKHWYAFFGREVPIHTGAEELARTYDMGIVYLSIRKKDEATTQQVLRLFSHKLKGLRIIQSWRLT